MRTFLFKFKVSIFHLIGYYFGWQHDPTFFQTWHIVNHWQCTNAWWNPASTLARLFCDLTGHEICSLPEDNNYEPSEDDIWCRWCNTKLEPAHPGELAPRRKE